MQHRLSESLALAFPTDLSHSRTSVSRDAGASVSLTTSMNMTDADQPAWFKRFIEEFRERHSHLSSELSKINARMDNMDQESRSVNQRLTEHSKEVEQVRNVLHQVTQRQNEIKASIINTVPAFDNVDPLEVKVSGIPADVARTQSEQNIVTSLFNSLDLSDLFHQVLLLRPWQARDNNDAGTSAVVIQFYSAGARDKILKRAGNLKVTDAAAIFPGLTTSKSRIFISAIWPNELFRRLGKPRRIARERGYHAQVVRNLMIYLRNARDTPAFPVLTDAQLDALPFLKPVSSAHSAPGTSTA